MPIRSCYRLKYTTDFHLEWQNKMKKAVKIVWISSQMLTKIWNTRAMCKMNRNWPEFANSHIKRHIFLWMTEIHYFMKGTRATRFVHHRCLFMSVAALVLPTKASRGLRWSRKTGFPWEVAYSDQFSRSKIECNMVKIWEAIEMLNCDGD